MSIFFLVNTFVANIATNLFYYLQIKVLQTNEFSCINIILLNEKKNCIYIFFEL